VLAANGETYDRKSAFEYAQTELPISYEEYPESQQEVRYQAFMAWVNAYGDEQKAIELM
jgi:hypothetical protein